MTRTEILASHADCFVWAERVDGTPEHEIENRASDAELRRFVGQAGGFEVLTDAECQIIRDEIARLVG